MKTIIIGAGLTGLAAARQLKNQAQVTVLEKAPFIGGLARTEHFEEFAFDLGGHRFFTLDSEINHFAEQLMGDEMIEVGRVSKIYKNGRFFYYPLRTEIIKHYNSFALVHMLFDYLYRKAVPLPDNSFENLIINRFGRKLYDEFFKNYTEKTWGLPCALVSKDFVDSRITNISLKRVILHALFKPKHQIRSFTDKFTYPEHGFGEIAKKLAEGIDIRLESPVESIALENGKIKGVFSKGNFFECDHLISTMPLTQLVPMLNPPQDVLEAVNALKYRSLLVVLLEIDKPQLTPYHWIYFPGLETFGRMHEPKNWSLLLAPKERTSAVLEVFCNENDSIWNTPDKKIIDEITTEFKKIFPVRVLGSKVVRVDHAYPIYDIHYQDNLGRVQKYISRFFNLSATGRTGGFQYINSDVCLKEGLAAAQTILP